MLLSFPCAGQRKTHCFNHILSQIWKIHISDVKMCLSLTNKAQTSKIENPMWRFWTRRLFLLSGFCMRNTSTFFSSCLGFSPWTLMRYWGLVQKLSERQKRKQFLFALYYVSKRDVRLFELFSKRPYRPNPSKAKH